MLAIMYCRQQRVEQIHAPSAEAAVSQASTMLELLTDEERKDWSLVIVKRREVLRLFGPKV